MIEVVLGLILVLALALALSLAATLDLLVVVLAGVECVGGGTGPVFR